jgi:aminoglycoside N3'-acetyltransferase
MSKPLPSRDDATEAAPPVTSGRLVRDLRELGVEPGQTLLVNASLGSIGWVEGGAPAVVAALRAVVGPAGNLVVPVGTEENSNFSRAQRDVIAGMTWDEIRAYRNLMPAFDKHTTPSGMGAIAEALRSTAGAVRSDHPQSSFAAIGPEAGLLMADHDDRRRLRLLHRDAPGRVPVHSPATEADLHLCCHHRWQAGLDRVSRCCSRR